MKWERQRFFESSINTHRRTHTHTHARTHALVRAHTGTPGSVTSFFTHIFITICVPVLDHDATNPLRVAVSCIVDLGIFRWPDTNVGIIVPYIVCMPHVLKEKSNLSFTDDFEGTIHASRLVENRGRLQSLLAVVDPT